MKCFVALVLFFFFFCFLIDSEVGGYVVSFIFAALFCIIMPPCDDCRARLTDEDLRRMHEELKRKYDKDKP